MGTGVNQDREEVAGLPLASGLPRLLSAESEGLHRASTPSSLPRGPPAVARGP